MSNTFNSKIKILYLYDYFMHKLNAFSEEGSNVSMGELLDYLKSEMDSDFERKSMYADISKINEYVSATHKVMGADSWITLEGRKYHKNQLEDEITVDEARLIVDAINTTEFTDTSLCRKIENMFPTYFDENSGVRALYPHEQKINRTSISWLNNIRSAIEERSVLTITYGYKLGDALVEKSKRTVSPIVLDWNNNRYYLIAIDNDAAKDLPEEDLHKALRRFRLDRMAAMSFTQDEYISFKTEKARNTALKNLLDNSVSAYSSDDKVKLKIVISGPDPKSVLKAYNAFINKVNCQQKIDDTKLARGVLKVEFDVADVPTLYTDLFEILTFEGVDLTIENEDIRNKFKAYINKAVKGLG
ncbi:MAG: WYL domain-containing protein [Saccharofermentans sp.]|nr:WYL domain-containing protein [Saccharofermentans sp.]